MKKQVNDEVMTDLCMKVKKYVEEKDWDSCMELIPRYMERYPNSAVPHNLLGIVLESQGHHPDAMRHFRAAWSLDPTFMPASQNIDAYSLYDSEKDVKPAYTAAHPFREIRFFSETPEDGQKEGPGGIGQK